MKRFAGLLFAVIIASSIAIAPAFAEMKGGMMGGGMMMKEHHDMLNGMMGMMKETMGILKDLNHTPTADQKKKLEEMMKKMDDMVKKHDEMMKQKEERMEQKKEMMEKKGGY